MKTSDNGRAFIRAREGVKLAAYQDGGGVWTIGYGHTRGVKQGQVINHEQADEFLDSDLRQVESCISERVTVALNQNQFDALVSFVFNVGRQAFSDSTLLKKLNEGNYRAAADQFTRWVYDNDQFVQGLYNRRVAERDLFLL
ncbi:lysozyme [Salmonella enterica subsp. enterica]|uniref:Lysozyme n=1 Tax=Salmonella enterica subsp. enterica serovar Abeokuta TaxID=2926665 RepID=A0A8T9INR8_SALET|nr:lysozyme [Salmonella enterica]EBY8083587.1 lysozyme [Salmonella enterica subsp. enterica serovar Banana]EDU0974159.1 lysozyme [Salmonella enterica subsp. enterica serovar Anderlecht]EDW4531641.1 lysozyme [Salmonella enterica subsp. enterica]EED8424374.1 lysozyme [Salmonella enterica subsp. enterica serovar Losangeles]EEJ3528493.1 lysozyme [Salmonella enterica subsp. enterica serovar Anderlecht]